uniref:Uncharacterized protein n=1 Tax=Rhizophora mucronata TaxID=61149 RepID=A0A2P2PZ20_RHIMU
MSFIDNIIVLCQFYQNLNAPTQSASLFVLYGVEVFCFCLAS